MNVDTGGDDRNVRPSSFARREKVNGQYICGTYICEMNWTSRTSIYPGNFARDNFNGEESHDREVRKYLRGINEGVALASWVSTIAHGRGHA